MKLKLFLIFIFTISIFAQEKERSLSVLSFNILHGANTNGLNNLDLIAKIISDADPDLVALQEVDKNTKRSEVRDIAKLIAEKTNLYYLFGKAIDFDDGEYGLAILSMRKLLTSKVIKLPTTKGNEKRILLSATTTTVWGDTIIFYNTHLDYKEISLDRLNQAKAIVDAVKSENHPSILAGDFNDIPTSKSIKTIEKEWRSVYKTVGVHPTFPSNNPTRKIDYIFYKPATHWKVNDSKVIYDSIASDHCAYWVKLQFVK